MHICGQINSARSRAGEDLIDGAPGDGLWSRFINHNPATPVLTLSPTLMSSVEPHAASVIEMPTSDCCPGDPRTLIHRSDRIRSCSQYVDVASLSVLKMTFCLHLNRAHGKYLSFSFILMRELNKFRRVQINLELSFPRITFQISCEVLEDDVETAEASKTSLRFGVGDASSRK